MKQVNFARTFLRLTALGYALAVAVVGLAVWFASKPILLDMQEEAQRAHLTTKANMIAGILDDFLDKARYASQSPSLRSFVVGQQNLEAQVRDELSGLPDLKNIRLLDYRGRDLLVPTVKKSKSHFLPVEALDGLADMIDGHAEATPKVRYRPGGDPTRAEFSITVPVVSRGVVEGLLAFEFDLDLSSVLSGQGDAPDTSLLTAFQHSQWSSWNSEGPIQFAVPMPDADFFLATDPDQTAMASKGKELVQLSISVAIVALLFPFAVLGVSGLKAIVRPHRELQTSQAQLFEKSERLAELAQVAEMATESVILTDKNGKTTWVNKAFTEITGYGSHEIVGKSPGSLLQGPETDNASIRLIRQAVEQKKPVTVEILNYDKSGKPHWINLSISPIPGLREDEMRFASISNDITQIKDAQAALVQEKKKTEHQALHDPLTGMSNRRFIDRVLKKEVFDCDTPRTLVRIDLDHFKNVNDTLGHAAGDFVLRKVAEILREKTRKGDIAARVGGDEFIILLSEGTTEQGAKTLIEKLRIEIRKDMEFEGKVCRIGASFGIASSLSGLVSNEELLKSADSALYVAKEAGRNKTVLYTPDVHQAVMDRRDVACEIESAIVNQEFVAFFQPQFDAKSQVLVGVEALARWQHPKRGLLPPSEFLEVADKLKFIPDIDRQIFAYGLDCCSVLNGEGLHVPKIAFNVGVNQLMNPQLSENVDRQSIGDTHVALEILESVLIEGQGEEFMDRVWQLRAQGFSIEVDDFGSGHASVISLQRLKPDVMKIDRELVTPVVNSGVARSLVKSIIEMGHALDIMVIAEGVETAQHAEIMRELGCDVFQGFHFARPMPFDQLRQYLRSGLDEASGHVNPVTAAVSRLG